MIIFCQFPCGSPTYYGVCEKRPRRTPHSMMQISPDQGQFMALLIRLISATRTIELGVYTGYSSLAVALALPPDGKIIACDVNEEWTSMARRYWAEAGVSHKVDLRLAPAHENTGQPLG